MLARKPTLLAALLLAAAFPLLASPAGAERLDLDCDATGSAAYQHHQAQPGEALEVRFTVPAAVDDHIWFVTGVHAEGPTGGVLRLTWAERALVAGNLETANGTRINWAMGMSIPGRAAVETENGEISLAPDLPADGCTWFAVGTGRNLPPGDYRAIVWGASDTGDVRRGINLPLSYLVTGTTTGVSHRTAEADLACTRNVHTRDLSGAWTTHLDDCVKAVNAPTRAYRHSFQGSYWPEETHHVQWTDPQGNVFVESGFGIPTRAGPGLNLFEVPSYHTTASTDDFGVFGAFGVFSTA